MDEGLNREKLAKIKELAKDARNVGIFIDFDNLYYSFRDLGVNVLDKKFDVINLLWDVYTKEKIRTIRAYADFDQVDIKMRDLQVKRLQVKQVYGNGQQEQNRKNASDIELSIDAIECSHRDQKIDTYVFVTADSDMIPVMSRMVFKGMSVHLYYLGLNTTQYINIQDYSHASEDLIELFNIDKERATPLYWKDDVLSHIKSWYLESSNRSKMYGGNWLNSDLQDKLFMSRKLASSVISELEKSAHISKLKDNAQKEGYVVTEGLDEFKRSRGIVSKQKTEI